LYREVGRGDGALRDWPAIEFIDDVAANQFRVVIARPRVGADTGEVTGEVQRLLAVMQGEMKRADIQAALGLKHEEHFRETYLRPAVDGKFIEMTIPDKPRSSQQRYRLTAAGKARLARLKK
jgi:ATP-dependent DNA helicase RecG